MKLDKEYFECGCYSPEHTLQLWLDEEEPAALYVYAFLGDNPWWMRIIKAVKYVFGYKCRYGHFDEFLLRHQDADRFIQLLQRYKKAAQKYPTDEDLDRLR